ncbi:L-alanine-DL-glutamate epimerase [Streptomyces sp. TLI_053]|uniref:enolase C-terminal domain-like protein n=1 Tax=Streptomyces sp. TLI_053 TaxID=1855352 RepID=UPI00087AF8BE|nr:enolase C-terminal domain-like protein [Streptomyces sp. TLI_053]SDT08598.1 L-alanine-DL-glutamate epimerase [Streptomyces sp. TLI_053]
MKITTVDVVLQDRPAVTPAFRWRDGLPGSEGAHTGGWLVLGTDEGHTGFAYCHRGPILADIVDRRLRAELLGADPLQREWLWHRMWEIDRIEELPLYLLGLVDVALWDIGGKAAVLPVHQLLGGFRTALPAYASTATFGSVEQYLDIADQCLELGYPAIKLHAWGDVRRDIELCTRLREHVGDRVPLMYDGSAGFDLLDAIRLGRVLSEADYLWYEEPMREFSTTAYRRLAEKVDVPLIVAETSDGAHMNTADFIANGSATAVRTSAGLRGGITGAMRTAHLADAYLMRAEVHGGGVVHTHLCMAISNTTYYESFVPADPVRREPAVDASGLVHAGTAPGIGYEAEWERESAPEGLRRFLA